MWLSQFSAYAEVENFVVAIDTKKESDIPASDIESIADEDAGKLKKAAKKRNKKAFANLPIAFTSQEFLSKIHETKTT